MKKETSQSRREFVKRGVYTAPAILTLVAAPEYAKAGSAKPPSEPPGPYPHHPRGHGHS